MHYQHASSTVSTSNIHHEQHALHHRHALSKSILNNINHATTNGHYPIHYAVMGTRKRDNPAVAVETVQFLLDCDPNVKLQNTPQELSLLHFACHVV